ncbi:hypothetical protein Tco_0272560 [Tanacetum coccineum]
MTKGTGTGFEPVTSMLSSMSPAVGLPSRRLSIYKEEIMLKGLTTSKVLPVRCSQTSDSFVFLFLVRHGFKILNLMVVRDKGLAKSGCSLEIDGAVQDTGKRMSGDMDRKSTSASEGTSRR